MAETATPTEITRHSFFAHFDMKTIAFSAFRRTIPGSRSIKKYNGNASNPLPKVKSRVAVSCSRFDLNVEEWDEGVGPFHTRRNAPRKPEIKASCLRGLVQSCEEGVYRPTSRCEQTGACHAEGGWCRGAEPLQTWALSLRGSKVARSFKARETYVHQITGCSDRDDDIHLLGFYPKCV